MDIIIVFSIFSVQQCMTLAYVTSLQTVISSSSARAMAGSSKLRNQGSIKASLRTNTAEGNESHHQRRMMIRMINMALKMKTRKNIPMKRRKLIQVSLWVRMLELA